MENKQLQEILERTRIIDLTKPQTVVVLRSCATIDLVLRSLATHRILSAPVVSVNNENSGRNVCRRGSVDIRQMTFSQEGGKPFSHIAGFVDLNVILTAFMKQVDAQQVSDMKLLQRMRILEETGQTFGKTQLQQLEIGEHSGSVFMFSEDLDISLLHHLQQGFFVSKENPRHRIALVDKYGHFTNIISQTDIMKFLISLPVFKNGVGCRSLEELNLVSAKVVCVGPDVSALEALLTMHKNGVMAVAVTKADTKQLIGNFSISELRTIMSEHFGALGLPVGEFLALEHGTEYAGYGNFHDEVNMSKGGQFVMGIREGQGGRKKIGNDVGQNLAVCVPTSTLTEVVEMMLDRRIHRVYVIQSNEIERLQSVVTYTDVLKVVLEVCGK